MPHRVLHALYTLWFESYVVGLVDSAVCSGMWTALMVACREVGGEYGLRYDEMRSNCEPPERYHALYVAPR